MSNALHRSHTRRPRAPRAPRARLDRRGVVGVLAMMFLVMFAALAAAMGVATQGNMRSAASYLRVVRAHGAVDSGMVLAESRLKEAVARFIVAKGELSEDDLDELWFGPVPGAPEVVVAAPRFPIPEAETPRSIQAALANIHAADATANLVLSDNPDNAPAPITLYSRGEDWLDTAPIGIQTDPNTNLITSATQISYGPPNAGGAVRVVVTGYDWDHTRARWVTRSAEVRYRVSKRVEYAIIANVPPIVGVGGNIDGPVGSAFDSDSLDTLDGSPVAALSDFYGLNPTLDRKLDDFYDAVLNHDIDGDNRLRTGHSGERVGLAAINAIDYDGDAAPDNAFADLTRDDAVDDFDVFLEHYDTNSDGVLVLSAPLTAGTPAATLTPEFTRNDALALLIDSGVPDRNRNGRRNGRFVSGSWDFSTMSDNNGDGTVDAGDLDLNDIALGYRDGLLDYRDRYAKMRGGIVLRAARTDWENSAVNGGVAFGDYQQYVQGPIRTDGGDQAVTFNADTSELPALSDDAFDTAATALRELQADASDPDFWTQVSQQMGSGWTPPTRIEATPFGAASPADWYARPVFEGLTLRNVTIPMGLNALFVDCTFVGITRVDVYENNDHPSFVFYGEQVRNGTGGLDYAYPPPPGTSDVALDQSYADPLADGYDQLPAPYTVPFDLDGDGTAPDNCYDTKLLSNNLRFHDCTIVGSIVADTTRVYTHLRNKMQFTGSTTYSREHPEYPDDPDLNPDDDHRGEIAKSSLLAPQWSVDIGSLNPPPTQDVRLRGAVIAGVLDVRGNAEIRGVILSTFRPVRGVAPLELYGTPVGNPANFNVSIGYATAESGDLEAIDTSGMSDLDADGTPDLGWDTAVDEFGAPVPLAGWDGAHNEAWYDGVPDPLNQGGLFVRRAIPFHGVGATRIEADPDMVLPDGLALPLSLTPVAGSYKEGA